MSYIAIDLDAKKRIPLVARACGAEPCVIGWGLVELWEHAWSAKTDTVAAIVVDACFGPSERIREALVAFGFLEPVETGFRVKGADRYLRIAAGRSEGGKKAAGNLRRGGVKPEKSPRLAPGFPPASPGLVPASAGEQPRLVPGLSPTSEHRAPNTEEKKQPPTPSGPVGGLDDDIRAVFRELRGADYSPHHGDLAASRALLGKAEPDEILRRWRIGLDAGFPACATLSDLNRGWNHYAKAKQVAQPYTGLRAAPVPEGKTCEVCGGTDRAGDTAGHHLCQLCTLDWWDHIGRARALTPMDWASWRASVVGEGVAHG
ncbi:MAG: hypothetical protein FJ298_14210 [Planctomycetes bacterium]|nr:hypothetical protein [Planctomycetota bacterium]